MRLTRSILTILICTLLLYSCSSSIFQRRVKVYQAPALGAETRFQEGLRRQKNPQQLFSNKERREMEKMGMISPTAGSNGREAPVEKISPAKADSMLYGIKPDTTRKTPADSTAVPALPDSTAKPKPDTTRKIPADSTAMPALPKPDTTAH